MSRVRERPPGHHWSKLGGTGRPRAETPSHILSRFEAARYFSQAEIRGLRPRADCSPWSCSLHSSAPGRYSLDAHRPYCASPFLGSKRNVSRVLTPKAQPLAEPAHRQRISFGRCPAAQAAGRREHTPALGEGHLNRAACVRPAVRAALPRMRSATNSVCLPLPVAAHIPRNAPADHVEDVEPVLQWCALCISLHVAS